MFYRRIFKPTISYLEDKEIWYDVVKEFILLDWFLKADGGEE